MIKIFNHRTLQTCEVKSLTLIREYRDYSMDSAHERLLFTICDTSKSEPVSAAKRVKFLYAKQRATKPGQNFFLIKSYCLNNDLPLCGQTVANYLLSGCPWINITLSKRDILSLNILSVSVGR